MPTIEEKFWRSSEDYIVWARNSYRQSDYDAYQSRMYRWQVSNSEDEVPITRNGIYTQISDSGNRVYSNSPFTMENFYTSAEQINNLKNTNIDDMKVKQQEKKFKIIPDPYLNRILPINDMTKILLNSNWKEIALENGARRFIDQNQEIVVNIGAATVTYWRQYVEYYSHFNINEQHLLNIENCILYNPELTPCYYIVSRYELPKNLDCFEVIINKDNGEIEEGKEKLQSYSLLVQEKAEINPKEEAVVNLRELADALAQKECEFYLQNFSIEKNFEKYIKAYKKYYKIILKHKAYDSKD